MYIRQIFYRVAVVGFACLLASDCTWAQSQTQGPSTKMSDKPFEQTASGLKYRILREGDGQTRANNASSVTVHYKGWLPEGPDGSSGKSDGYTWMPFLEID